MNNIIYSEQRDEEKETSSECFASERGVGPRSGTPFDSNISTTYHGARYYDAVLLTGWLSVDPLADKYPGISPYNYCVWNPIVSIDPTGTDTIRIHLDKGQFMQCEGGNPRVELYMKNEMVGHVDNISANPSFDFYTGTDPDDGSVFNTTVLHFPNQSDGMSVFSEISLLALNPETRSPIEWDYYGKNDGSGDLVTSRRCNKVFVGSDYSSPCISSWDHYHPTNSEGNSWIPSGKDLAHLSGLPGIPCSLHTAGVSYRMDKVFPYRGNRENLLRKIQGCNPNIKSFMQ